MSATIRRWFREADEEYWRDVAMLSGGCVEPEEPTSWQVEFHESMSPAEWAHHLRIPGNWKNWTFDERGEFYLQDALGRAFFVQGVELDQMFADGQIKIKDCIVDEIKLIEVE